MNGRDRYHSPARPAREFGTRTGPIRTVPRSVIVPVVCVVALSLLRAASAAEVRAGWHEQRTPLVGAADTVIQLPQVILFRDSVHVWIDSLPLAPGYDFRVDYLARTVVLSHPWPSGVVATVRYRALPVSWPTHTAFMVPSRAPSDTSATGRPFFVERAPPEAADSGGSLRIGGSKTFAVQVGSNQSLSLEQSLRVSVNGTVGKDVEVTAELSDQNLPIQPEGTTEDLREIDKVLVEVKSPHYRAVLGNYDLNYSKGEFGQYQRQLDGALGEVHYGNWSVTGAVATARGKYRTYVLPVIDGNQGPYPLVDDNGNTGVIVIAGSEQVWIDGALLRRGLNNDYTMDYAAGEITFTRRRLITQDMRIVVDYEFASQNYSRTSAMVSGDIHGASGKWELSAFYAQEGDNANDPLSLSLNDSSRAIIAAAGNDPALASVPGWSPSDSGSYVAVNLAAEDFNYVGPGRGTYNVAFTRVGPGNGTYVRAQGYFAEDFQYVGPGAGDWLPRILYPLPQQTRLFSAWSKFSPVRHLSIESEIAASNFDQNTLSPIGNANNTHFAGRLEVTLDRAKITAGGMNLGTLTTHLIARGVQKGFTPLSRITSVEDNRRWGLGLETVRSEERTVDLDATYRPRSGQRLYGDVGWFSRDTVNAMPAYRAWRAGGGYATEGPGLPAISLYAEQILSRQTSPGDTPIYGTTRRGNGSFGVTVWHLAPSIRLEGESVEQSRADTTFAGTRYGLWQAGLATARIEAFAASASIAQRADDVYDSTTVTGWQAQERSLTQTWRASVRQWHGLSGTGEYTWRRLRSPLVGQTSVSDAADVSLRDDAFDGLARNAIRYRVSATRTAQRQRVYVYVGSGKGEYAPLNPNDQRLVLSDADVIDVPAGDPRASYVVQYYTTDNFTPTVDLDASWSLGLDFSRVWRGALNPRSPKRRPFWQRALRNVATETQVEVTETDSTRNANLYLVKFWTFRRFGVSPTVRGSWQLTQDVTLWPNARRGDLRFRISDYQDFDASLIQNGGLPATTTTQEYSLRGRLRFIPQNLDWLSELSWQHDVGAGSQFDYRAKRILFDQTWAWHPTFAVEWSLRNQDGVGTDPTPDATVAADPSRPLTAYFTTLEPGIRRAWGNRGMLNLTGQWSGVFGRNVRAGSALPIRLLNGRNVGNNFQWSALLTYRLSSLVTASINYTGTKTPGSPVIHSGRAEVRATF